MTIKQAVPRLGLFPITAEVSNKGHLIVGGCNTIELAEEFGTPLYVFDEYGMRNKCAEFRGEFGQRYADTLAVYASKAFMNRAMALLIKEEGLGLDVVSGGEMSIARSVDFPLGKVYFHGNNKSAEELRLALKWKVGRIVVDNFHELQMLDEIAGEAGSRPDILLRLNPGVDPHTHLYNTTGIIDSKFGFPMPQAENAVTQSIGARNLNLIGLHLHIGSGVFEVEPYKEAIGHILDFAAAMKQRHGFEMREFDVGGGFAVQYTMEAPAPPIAGYAEAVVSTVMSKCRELKLGLPRLIIEPGRAIVGRAGIALYHVGVVKEIPGVRTYVSVDGGMADNIRYALYGARHEAVVANKMLSRDTRTVTVAGKFCESGDILIKDIDLPPVMAGDVLAVADSGAYCLSMASNYNASLKVAVVFVKDGKARLVRRRETYDDLTRWDVV